jgi:hypothetical protein
LLSLFTNGFVDYGQKCTVVGVIGLGGKFNSAVSLPAINVNLGPATVVPVAFLIPQPH